MKIVVSSDSPYFSTGFAGQMHHVANYLGEKHEVHYLGWQTRGHFRGKFSIPGINYQIHDGGGQIFGTNGYMKIFNEIKPSVVITLGDAHMVEMLANALRPFWIGYYPLDGDPIPQRMANTFRGMDVRVAMSMYGAALTQQLGLPVEHIPHCYDPEVFKPTDKTDAKEWAETRFGIPKDKFVIGSVARLNPRKHHMLLLSAFRKFKRKREDAVLYLHLDKNDPMFSPDKNHNYMFEELIYSHELVLGEDVILPPDGFDFINGIPEDEMHMLYNAFDVHGIATGGEGFGVPTIEAMACGTPSVLTDYTTSSELLDLNADGSEKLSLKKRRGLTVDVGQKRMEISGVHKAWIDIGSFFKKLKKYYNDRELLARHSKNGVAWAKEHYEMSVVLPKWDNVLERVNDRVEMIDGANTD